MSSGEARQPTATLPPEWDRLELGVRRLLDDYDLWRRRARGAERRVQELEATLRDITGGALDPLALLARIEALQEENRALRGRLAEARAKVERIVARLRFLEEER
ncbi:MAG TPA: hypothetical protein VIL13_08270 [Longimicrobiales bacterium]